MTEKERVDERIAAAFKQDGTPDRAVVQAWAAQYRFDAQAQLRSTFGEAVFENYQFYEGTGALRVIADKLATALFHSATPLSIPQSDQLVGILADHARNAEGKFDVLAINNEAMLSKAQTILSVAQVAALRRVAEDAQTLEKVNIERRKAPPAPARPPTN